jgi:hypothetical protein
MRDSYCFAADDASQITTPVARSFSFSLTLDQQADGGYRHDCGNGGG